jgi:hypothetical protein
MRYKLWVVKMIIENDELVIWAERSRMIIGGDVVEGTLMLTNKSMTFVQARDVRSFITRKKEDVEIWKRDIWDILSIDLLNVKGFKYPAARVRYKEEEVYFTFPDLEPNPTIAAMIVFVNHARLINKNISLVHNIEKNLKSGELKVGDRLPKLVIDQPLRPDETCHQCAKTMLEQETDELSSEIHECLICEDI